MIVFNNYNEITNLNDRTICKNNLTSNSSFICDEQLPSPWNWWDMTWMDHNSCLCCDGENEMNDMRELKFKQQFFSLAPPRIER